MRLFRAIGMLVLLIGLSYIFSEAFGALEGAATETLRAVEQAALSAQVQMSQIQ